MRYGTRIATTAILYNKPDEQEVENPPVSKNENCPENPVQCDGIKDCLLGSDETVCGEKAHTYHIVHTYFFVHSVDDQKD